MRHKPNPKFDLLKDQVSEFPTQSGVYLMKNEGEKIIYVGKAKNLRARVKSYFQDLSDQSAKTVFLVSNIRSIEFIVTKTEVEAFLLEASLIKKHRPKYNIRLKDDKSYPYIRLTMKEDFPRLYLARKVKKDDALYFGPYTSGSTVFGMIRFLNQTFRIRDCNDHVFKSRTRPCMTYQIGRCTAPCVNLVTKEDYRSDVEQALQFLKGRDKKVLKSLNEKMSSASELEKYEQAARYRDSISSIKAILQKQAVINDTSELDQDAISFYGSDLGVSVQMVHVRAGRVLGTRSQFLPLLDPNDTGEDPREWLVSFMNQYYEDNSVPDEVLLSVDLGGDMNKLMQAVLKERAGKEVRVRFATDEKGRALVEMASQNAKISFEKYTVKSAAKTKGLEDIKNKLHLPELPSRIECFDISNFQGSEVVASQVVFEDGVPAKDHYRRYKIKTLENGEPNDFQSMREVIERRFKHSEYDEPQLIVVDGGKGQLSSAFKILQELGLEKIPIVGIAKSRTQGDFTDASVEATEERFFIPGRSNPVTFQKNAEALHILVGIRDEAHRFAITYHRKLRENQSLQSILDEITGLGEARKKTLLNHFSSIDAIRESAVEEIEKLKGFNRVLAERILLHLSESGDFDAGS